jgi:hypothetical protein
MPRALTPVVLFFRDASGFTAWCLEHPAGYVLNTQQHGSGARLHRAECGTIAPHQTRRSDPTARLKVCATTRAAIETWARERGETFLLCPNCDV